MNINDLEKYEDDDNHVPTPDEVKKIINKMRKMTYGKDYQKHVTPKPNAFDKTEGRFQMLKIHNEEQDSRDRARIQVNEIAFIRKAAKAPDVNLFLKLI